MPYKDMNKRREVKAASMRKARKDGKAYATDPRNSYQRRAAKRREEGGPPPLPIFVALDGEGVNQDDGSQWYTLLLAHTLDGHLGDYAGDCRTLDDAEYSNGGLSTERCLRFILKACKDPKQKYISFFFGYDVTKIVTDLPDEIKDALWRSSWVVWQGEFDSYYLKYIPNKFLTVGLYRGDPTDHPFNPRKDIQGEVSIYDVSGFFQKSLVKALKEWDVCPKDILERIEGMKNQRNDFASVKPAEIRRYCKEECEFLIRMMNKLAAALWDLGLYLTSWHGAGAVADRMFEKQGVREHLGNAIEDGSDLEAAILGAYFGGRVELFRQGFFPDGVYDYDLQSAYPSAAISLPSLKGAEWKHISSPTPEMVVRFSDALFRVAWDVTEPFGRFKYKRRVPGLVGPLPFRSSGRITFPFQAGPTWIHAEELQTAMSLFGTEKFTLLEAWLPVTTTEWRPFSFLEAMATERIQAKMAGNPKHLPLKLGMNSVYGKLAQGQRDPHKKPKHLSYYHAGRITARTRAMVLRAAVAAGDGIVSVATDGVFTTRPVAGLPFGNTPGTWELSGESSDPMLFIQPGVAFSESGVVTKTRGFGRTTLTYDDREVEVSGSDGLQRSVHEHDAVRTAARSSKPKRASRRGGAGGVSGNAGDSGEQSTERRTVIQPGLKTLWLHDGPDGRADYRERRFIGLGASSGRGDWQDCGQWREQERSLKFFNIGLKLRVKSEYPYASASVVFPDGFDGSGPNIYRLVPMDFTGIESEPYVKPHLVDDSASVELLTLLEQEEHMEAERLDQPDWAGYDLIEEEI